MKGDQVDRLRHEWAQALPDLDTASLEVTGRVLRLADRIEAAAASALQEHRLSLGDFSTLVTLRRLYRPEGLQPSELTAATLVTSGATTGRLDRLEAAGLVRRQPDPGDRRGVRVHLTHAGARLAEAAIRDVMASGDELLASLSSTERTQLVRCLRKVATNTVGSGRASARTSDVSFSASTEAP